MFEVNGQPSVKLIALFLSFSSAFHCRRSNQRVANSKFEIGLCTSQTLLQCSIHFFVIVSLPMYSLSPSCTLEVILILSPSEQPVVATGCSEGEMAKLCCIVTFYCICGFQIHRLFWTIWNQKTVASNMGKKIVIIIKVTDTMLDIEQWHGHFDGSDIFVHQKLERNKQMVREVLQMSGAR